MPNNSLHVGVGSLFPGTHINPGTNLYFPELTWKVYQDTFSMLNKHPKTYGHTWELREMWTRICEKRFGYEPKGGESPDDGGAWAWPVVEACFRRMHASYNLHGYVPPKISAGEHYQVAINADGRMCVLQGNKRVALLRMHKGLKYKIDVEVVKQAPGWIAVKESIRRASGDKEVCYQPMSHPDLASWQITQPCKERLKMMSATEPSKSILDLGCHTGWFCRKLKTASNRVVGVEENAGLIQAAQTRDTWRYENPPHRPEYVHSTIGEYLDSQSEQFDTCLYLSIIMHVFARLEHGEAWAQLKQISQRTQRMYMDIVYGGYAKHFPFTPETMPDEVIKYTEFTSFKLLGRTNHENRPFYVFQKS